MGAGAIFPFLFLMFLMVCLTGIAGMAIYYIFGQRSRTSNREVQRLLEENRALNQTMQRLEQRVQNLETIVTSPEQSSVTRIQHALEMNVATSERQAVTPLKEQA